MARYKEYDNKKRGTGTFSIEYDLPKRIYENADERFIDTETELQLQLRGQ